MSKLTEKAAEALETSDDYAHTDLHKLVVWLVTAFVLALLEIADAIRYSD